MRSFCAGALLLWALGAQAYTVDVTLSNLNFEVIDLTPGDANSPSFTVTSSQNVSDLLTPLDYHHASSNEPAPPPSTGSTTTWLQGYLSPGTALHWTGTASMTLSVIDVDNGFDIDRVSAIFEVDGTPTGSWPYSQAIPGDLIGSGGSYQRIVSASGPVTFDVVIQGPADSSDPVPFTLGYTLSEDGYASFTPRPPIPEPGTWALVGVGLAALAARRAAARRG